MSAFEAGPGGVVATVWNDTGVPDGEVYARLTEQHPEVAAVVRWASDSRATRQSNSLFQRDRYISVSGVMEKFRVAQEAVVVDDVVSGVVETTESLAFGKVTVECDDSDETSIWQQIADEIDLDSRIREMWREVFAISHVNMGTWWGFRNYKVDGKSDQGIKRKKSYNQLRVPTGVTVLDPVRVVPVGNTMFGQESLAWIANRGETDRIDAVLSGLRASDPIIDQLLVAPYMPDPEEMRALGELGIAFGKLYELNPATVFRHTDTKPQYQRFANIRMESIFPLLDMKNLLREMDRATLLGATNYLVLVTKGDKDKPGTSEEITNLNNMVRTMARTPVIVGDHRLHVEIVSPKTDHTLTHDRYALLDNRISARLFQMFGVSNFQAGARSDNSITLARVIARGLEGRREQLRRAIEKYVLLPCWRYNEALVNKPRLVFQPKRVSLDFDPALMTALMDLGDRRQISRASLLDELGFDEENEARLLQVEKERFDDIFQTVLPGATGLGGGTADARSAGRRQGGTKNGGGNKPGTNNPSDPGQPDRDPGSNG